MSQFPSSLAAFHDFAPEEEDFGTALVDGLTGTPKSIPCKFFYDQRGSRLFDEICRLDEYYVTRTETALLDAKADEIAKFMGENCHLIEFGSGSSVKVRILLDALGGTGAYTAIDISRDHLLASTAALAEEYPAIAVTAVCADYTKPFDLPVLRSLSDSRPVFFFPGSTIGNFNAAQAREFLARVAKWIREHAGALVIGIDLKKDIDRLIAAYDDSRGITAAFNLNLLVRANAELKSDFDLSAFHHEARYDVALGRIEMYLVSDRRQTVTIGVRQLEFDQGEAIHTENSHKYTVDEFHDLARSAGFEPVRVWMDPDRLFSLHYLEGG